MTNLHAVVVTYTYDFNSNRLIRLRTPDTDNDGLPDSLEKMISDQDADQGIETRPISFTVNDADTPAHALRITANSSNPELTPDERIILEGSGFGRVVKIIPAGNVSGTAEISGPGICESKGSV